ARGAGAPRRRGVAGEVGARSAHLCADAAEHGACDRPSRGRAAARGSGQGRVELEPDRAGGERRRAGWPGRAQQRRAAGRDRRDAARARGGAGVDSGGLVMIAKITRGERVGDIAAYLHGPGKANEHHYIQDKRRHIGGMVIASNIGAEGATDPAEWAADLRLARQQRPEITKPIWQASLRAAPGDRVMGDREWADIASRFMEEMGVG